MVLPGALVLLRLAVRLAWLLLPPRHFGLLWVPASLLAWPGDQRDQGDQGLGCGSVLSAHRVSRRGHQAVTARNPSAQVRADLAGLKRGYTNKKSRLGLKETFLKKSQ